MFLFFVKISSLVGSTEEKKNLIHLVFIFNSTLAVMDADKSVPSIVMPDAGQACWH